MLKENDYLNDEKAWLKGQSHDAPLSKEEVARIQPEINSIIGTGGNGQPILKLVWNGDVDFWEEIYYQWNSFGEPIKSAKRPLVLFKSIWSDDKKDLIKDVFVPRWLLLRRSEPEQYADTWESLSYMRSAKFTRLEYVDTPTGRVQVPQPQKILFRPTTAPRDGWYRWFMTIGEHDAEYKCCAKAAENNVNCYGDYAHPRAGFEELYRIAEARKTAKDQPFDAPEEVAQRHVERGNHNYFNQTMRAFEQDGEMVLDRPELYAPNSLIESSASLRELRTAANESLSRELDKIERNYRTASAE